MEESCPMEKYKCKICSKLFNNGRALGGHMKPHFAKLPIFTLPKKEKETSYSISDAESELLKGPTNSKELASLVSDTTIEEDVAFTLMMLSRDRWVDSVKNQCEICGEVFKSSQALGGHKTSHRKPTKKLESTRLVTRVERKKIVKAKNHECSICNKVFGSGQAFGEHKRTHFLIAPVTNYASSSDTFGETTENNEFIKFGDNWIDLNMPAPAEDGEMFAIY